MNCPKCNTSKVEFQSEVSWLIPWEPHYDENGSFHEHNPNKHFMDFKCEQGHVFEATYFPTCACGWQNVNA